jgi:hypothetical protein
MSGCQLLYVVSLLTNTAAPWLPNGSDGRGAGTPHKAFKAGRSTLPPVAAEVIRQISDVDPDSSLRRPENKRQRQAQMDAPPRGSIDKTPSDTLGTTAELGNYFSLWRSDEPHSIATKIPMRSAGGPHC